MRSRFEDLEAGLLAAIRSGSTLEDAAQRAGVSVNTARGWAREGRKRPDGRFGGFVLALDAARADAAAVETEPMSWDEFEGHLAGAVRSGSTTAMKLFADLHRHEGEEPAQVDAFTALDELAARRAAS